MFLQTTLDVCAITDGQGRRSFLPLVGRSKEAIGLLCVMSHCAVSPVSQLLSTVAEHVVTALRLFDKVANVAVEFTPQATPPRTDGQTQPNQVIGLPHESVVGDSSLSGLDAAVLS